MEEIIHLLEQGGGIEEIVTLSISETQFKAEQALVAGLGAFFDEGNMDYVETSGDRLTVKEAITVEGAGKIKEGSYIERSSEVPNTKAGNVNVDISIIFEPETEGAIPAEVVEVSLQGTAANDSLTSFTADGYTAKVGNVEEDFSETTPSAFIAKDNTDSILDMINGYLQNPSYAGEFKIYEKESFKNGNNSGWIVFSNSVIDGSKHKANFVPVNGLVSEFTLDGCVTASSDGVSISEKPSYKAESLSLNDEGALNTALEYYAYSGLVNDLPESDKIDITANKIEFKGYTESSFFSEPRTLTGTITVDPLSATIDLKEENGNSIYLEYASDGGSMARGSYTALRINDENYSHLFDALYRRTIGVYMAASYLQPFLGYTMSGDEGITQNGTEYTLKNVDVSGFTANGTIVQTVPQVPQLPEGIGPEDPEYQEYMQEMKDWKESILNKNYSFRIDITAEEENALPIVIKADGTLGYYGSMPEEVMMLNAKYSSLSLPSHGGAVSSEQVAIVNKLIASMI